MQNGGVITTQRIEINTPTLGKLKGILKRADSCGGTKKRVVLCLPKSSPAAKQYQRDQSLFIASTQENHSQHKENDEKTKYEIQNSPKMEFADSESHLALASEELIKTEEELHGARSIKKPENETEKESEENLDEMYLLLQDTERIMESKNAKNSGEKKMLKTLTKMTRLLQNQVQVIEMEIDTKRKEKKEKVFDNEKEISNLMQEIQALTQHYNEIKNMSLDNKYAKKTACRVPTIGEIEKFDNAIVEFSDKKMSNWVECVCSNQHKQLKIFCKPQ